MVFDIHYICISRDDMTLTRILLVLIGQTEIVPSKYESMNFGGFDRIIL